MNDGKNFKQKPKPADYHETQRPKPKAGKRTLAFVRIEIARPDVMSGRPPRVVDQRAGTNQNQPVALSAKTDLSTVADRRTRREKQDWQNQQANPRPSSPHAGEKRSRLWAASQAKSKLAAMKMKSQAATGLGRRGLREIEKGDRENERACH
jgi:hypothetical protein